MPKFVTDKDIRFFHLISRELVDDVVENLIVLYKIILDASATNIYGESDSKTYYEGVQVAALIERDDNVAVSEGFGIDSNQNLRFKMLRDTLEDKGIYPEIGDYVGFNNSYYEIDNVIENQFIAGQPVNNYSIVCPAHLSRNTTLNIQGRNI